MRGFAFLVSVVLLVPLPAFWGAAQAVPGLLIQDPAGDVRFEMGSQRLPGLSAPGDVDLVSLGLSEGLNEVTFSVAQAAHQSPSGVDAVLTIRFDRGQVEYQLMRSAALTNCLAVLERFQPGPNDFVPISCVDTKTTNLETSFTVPKTVLVDEQGIPLYAPANLTSIQASARISGPRGTSLADDAPDEAYGSWQTALDEGGPIVLRTIAPIRNTNGEATTLAYNVQATNHLDDGLHLAFRIPDLPQGWTPHVPAAVTLRPGQTISVPVFVEVPFAHEHGRTQLFHVVAEDTDDPSAAASLVLGLHWLDVPQPSGHHPDVFLHSREANGTTSAWFNAEIDDSLADESGIPLDGQPAPTAFVNQAQTTPIWLSPSLALGLQFERNATMRATFDVAVPTTVKASARLWLFLCDFGTIGGTQQSPWCKQPAGFGNMSELFDVRGPSIASSNGVLHFDLNASLSFNRTRFERNEQMNFGGMIILYGESPADTATIAELGKLLPQSFHVELPLRDFQDGLSRLGFTETSLAFQASAAQRQANPGATVVFPVTLSGPAGTDVALSFIGVSADWVSLPPTLRLPPSGISTFSLVAKIPPGVAPGEKLSGYLEATHEQDVALLPIQIEVVDPANHHIGSDPLPPAPDHSAPWPTWSVGALLALAWVRSKRFAR